MFFICFSHGCIIKYIFYYDYLLKIVKKEVRIKKIEGKILKVSFLI